MLSLLVALSAVAFAEEPSYMDLFGGAEEPADTSNTGTARPVNTTPAPAAAARSAAEPTVPPAAPTPDQTELDACLDQVAAATAPDTPDDAPTRSPISVTAGLGVASHYFFRGYNTFGTGPQDPAAMIAPSLEASVGPVTFGWWGAFQGTGSNRDSVVRSGSGHEQDLYVSVGHSLSDRVAISGGLLTYIYPFARAKEAGTSVPFWVEPNVSLSADVGVSLGLYAAWTQGVQPGIAASSYGYLSGSIAHSVPIAPGTTLDMSADAGAKAVVDPTQWSGNTLDATLTWGLTWSNDTLSISPAGHLTWANLPAVSAGEETVLWFGLDTGVSL